MPPEAKNHPPIREPIEIPINVSSRVLRHISRGIYRTPAGALKELISNSHDAGAAEVTVNTGYPTIKELVITDDGSGMTAQAFQDIVKHIGFSHKTAGDTIQIAGKSAKRTVIGHYGIGLLAVGQLAARMQLTSKPAGTREGFTADLDFDQFDRVSEAGVNRSRIKDERTLETGEAKATDKQDAVLSIGRCRLTDTRYSDKDSSKHFTRITLLDVREDVFAKLHGVFRDLNPAAAAAQRYSSDYESLLRFIREHERDLQQGLFPYERLVWELGVYCPVSYPLVGPFAPKGDLHDFTRLASAYSFSVKVDGMSLRKPLEASFFEDSEFPIEQVFSWKDEPYTADPSGPRVTGYLFYKRRIRPRSLQGILVRESGVAVGMYDTTFLQYPFNEGQKFNQLSGELFASGLSGALNIDRNSFNETDGNYLAMCKWFHGKLQREVFPAIKKMQKSPGAKRRRQNIDALLRDLNSLTPRRGLAGVRADHLGTDGPLLKISGKYVIVNRDHPDGSGSSARLGRVMLATALVLIGAATPEGIERAEIALNAAKRERSRHG